MNPFREVHLAQIVARLCVGVALMSGGALVAKRSIASASWAALAGFSIVAGDVARAYVSTISIRIHVVPYELYSLVSLIEAAATLGALVASVRSLPARAA